ncbi:MAG: O-antigen ligase family protein [Chloroflexi bacterium]|nr:O-antigen ligase family protein [Chloroflexota bacterium]
MTLSHRIIFILSAAIILVCPVIIDPYITLAFAAPKMVVLQLGALIGMAVVLIHWLRVGQAMDGERLPRPVAILFIAWMSWMALTMIWSVLPQLSLVGNFYWQLGLFTKISLVSLAYLTFIATRESQNSDLLYRLFIIASVPVVIYGLLQTINRDPITWWLMGKVVFSTFGNPNYFAGYLIMVMPPTLIESLRSQVRLWRIFCALLFVGQLICFIATDSRGGFIAGFVALALSLLWLWRFDSKHAKWIASSLILSSLILTLIIGLGGETLGEALRQMGFVKNLGSVETRQYAWETAWRMMVLRPQGWGMGAFEIMHLNYATPGFMEYAQKFLIPFGAVMDRTHNLWTEIGVELGVIGLMIWIGLLAVVGVTVLRHCERSPRSNLRAGTEIASRRLAMTSVIAGMIGYLLHLTVNPSEIGGEIVFWWLIGWGLGVSCRQPREGRASKLISFIVIATMFGIALFGFIYARQFFLF